MSILMSIPCVYENETLTVASLGLSAKASSPSEAYKKAIKDTKLTGLSVGQIEKKTDVLKIPYFSLIVPQNEEILDFILSREPLSVDKPKKKTSNHLIDASPEDVLKLGY